MVGQVVLGPRGPAPVVFPTPVQLGPPSTAHPVRVPDASLRDIAVFAQDEWRLRPEPLAGRRPARRLLQRDDRGRRRATTSTPSSPARSPPIDPSTLPDPNGATYTRQSLTGDIGLVANQGGTVSPFVRFGRSYRHPNLEEMLFAGPATVGSIVPNVTVKPETGQQLRRRREVRGRPRVRRRLFLREPVPGLHRAGSGRGRRRRRARWRRRPTTPTCGSAASSSRPMRRSRSVAAC